MSLNTDSKFKKLVIIGAGEHGVSVANVALSQGYHISYFVDVNKAGQVLFNSPVIKSVSDIANFEEFAFAIAIGDNSTREKVYNELTNSFGLLSFPVLVHKSAVISFNATLAEGCVVMPQAVVGPNSRVEKFCLLNTMSSIDHDCTMDSFSSTAPGAIAGGKVKIGRRSVLSIGAVVKHGVSIGNDTVIGANSYVNKNINSNVVAYGSPAKIIRDRVANEPYLK